jgi:asparagine synthase (glutamine-hydrolysing)
MCGIAGFWDQAHTGVLRRDIENMLSSISHRGPDDHGVYEDSENGILFGHRRLSILDLSIAGQQPMKTESGDIVITYNGEVYNFKIIKKELEKLGHHFRSQSDTEVIIKSYQEWGIEAIHKFRGMFAFAIWDRRINKIYLVRDRAGVKPLYYAMLNGCLVFASEPKAILSYKKYPRKLNNTAVSHYLQFGYISPPITAYYDMSSVRPGHYIEIAGSGEIREIKYWDILDHYQEGHELERSGYWSKRTEEDVIEELEEVMTQAFEYRMVSDVPVGLFLSGGIDSSLVAAILAKKLGINLKTFTIGYTDKSFNEAIYAKEISEALGTSHTELYCNPASDLEMIEDIPKIYDEPFGDNSVIPTYLVSQLARRHVKVALSGDGGDELFCGYSRFNVVNNYWRFLERTPHIIQYISQNILDALPISTIDRGYRVLMLGRKRRAAFRDKIVKVKQMIANNSQPEIYEAAISYWYKEQLDLILKNGKQNYIEPNNISNVFKELGDASIIDKMMCLDFKKYMVDDVLVKVDRASMAVGLEAREPLLDHKLAEYAAKLPLHYKYRNGENKYILKKILFKYLPKSLFQRPKQGFSVPVDAWLRGPLRPLVNRYLNEDILREDGIFNAVAVRNAVDCFYERGSVSALNIWYLLEFQMWKKQWLI